MGKKEFGCCLIGLSSIWDNRIFAGWHTIKRHQFIQSFSSWKETKPFPNNLNSIATQVYFDFVLLGNARLTNLLARPVHQILAPHFFLLFQCFTTFAEPTFSRQHSKLLTMSNWWQTEMKIFITCVPCCQSTKSVCHCCTTKISIQFLPLSKKYSNCVKHSLPERRLYTIVPDIHTGWSIKKALHSSLNNSFSASSYVFLDQHSIFSREIPSQAREIKTFVIGPPI